jgi:hypothetical protein
MPLKLWQRQLTHAFRPSRHEALRQIALRLDAWGYAGLHPPHASIPDEQRHLPHLEDETEE